MRAKAKSMRAKAEVVRRARQCSLVWAAAVVVLSMLLRMPGMLLF